MNIREAVSEICGDDLARSIIEDMGMRWAGIAALADPRAGDHPEAKERIKRWFDSLPDADGGAKQ